MNIDEAIKILEAYLRGDEPDNPSDLPASFRLSIEAMKREIANRNNPDYVIVGKLPGETED